MVELLDYQREAIVNMFGNGEEKVGFFERERRSATVVLPTGGGKSFVAMHTIEEMMQRSSTEPSTDPNVISNFGLYYFAPNTGILYQFRLHMAEHMIYPHYLEEYKKENQYSDNELIRPEEIEKAVKEILRKIDPDGKKFKEDYTETYEKIIKEKGYSPEKDAEKIVSAIVRYNLKSIKANDLEEIVSTKYPNMKFECYQNLPNLDLKEVNPEFFIFDEAHRGGAKTWIKQIEKLAKTKTKSKFLCITATPERNSDENDLMTKIAFYTGYNADELREEAFYAKEYYLVDALRDGVVVSPKIVGFPCTLDESDEYRDVLDKIAKIEIKRPRPGSADYEKLNALRIIKDKMDEIIGKKGLTEEQWKVRKKELIEETIRQEGKEVTFNPNGKYIGFIPDSRDVELTEEEIAALPDDPNDPEVRKKAISKAKSEKNVQIYIEKLKEIYGEEIEALIYHSTRTENQTKEALQRFGFLSSTEGGNKFIITNKKLDEGVHVEDTDGEIVFEKVSKNDKESLSTKFLQKLGRCIRVPGPNQRAEEIKVPIIYDYANNFMRNYELLKTANGEMLLDYDQTDTRVAEFFELYEIASKGVKSHSRAGKNGEMWDVFTVGKEKIRFPDPNKRKETYKRKSSRRMDVLVDALKILKESNVNPPIDLKNITETTVINDEFFKTYNFDPRERDRVLKELIKAGVISSKNPEYNLGEELHYTRKVFFGAEKDPALKTAIIKKISESEDRIKEFAELGIIYIPEADRLLPEYEKVVDINGFIKPSFRILNHDETLPIERMKFLNSLVEINVSTGTKYYMGKDEYGCYAPGTKDANGQDIGGYDDYGYDQRGFDRSGLHRITGQRYDERQFTRVTRADGKIEYLNIFTGQSTDVFGYDIDGIDPRSGFDNGMLKDLPYEPTPEFGDVTLLKTIVHRWHVFDELTKKFSRLHTKYSKETGKDAYDATTTDSPSKVVRKTFMRDGKSKRPGGDNPYYDADGLDIDGFDKKGFKLVEVEEDGKKVKKYFHRETSSEYDLTGRNHDGKLEPNLLEGIRIISYILKHNDEIKNNPDKYRKILEKNYPGKSLDDILDKALSMYRVINKTMIQGSKLGSAIEDIESKIYKTDYSASVDLIGRLSPKFQIQVLNIAKRKAMDKVYDEKMGKLLEAIIGKYGGFTQMPEELRNRLIELNNKYGKTSPQFITRRKAEDPNYRSF